MRKTLLILFSIVFGFNYGQTASRTLISTGGGTYSQGGMQIDCSIGETITQTYSDGTYVLNQGFQQGNLTVSGIEDFDESISINVFPNPTQKTIKINWASFDNTIDTDYQVIITDVSGKILQDNPLDSEDQEIDVSAFKSGVYLLVIRHNNKTLKSFKIIKTN